jgi:hypothetical protein
MLNLNELLVSYHFQNDRAERKERIDAVLGGNYGQIIKQVYCKGAIRCLTDMGLIFIVNEQQTLILTYYFARKETIYQMYKGKLASVPSFIVKRVDKNARKYKKLYNDSMYYDRWYELHH